VDAQGILARDAARSRATIAGDLAALERLLHDDLTYAHSSGFTDTKRSFLDALATGRFRYRRIEHADETVRVYGGSALVTGRATIDIDVDGAPRTLRLAFLAVWVETSAGWQLAAWQSATLPA